MQEKDSELADWENQFKAQQSFQPYLALHGSDPDLDEGPDDAYLAGGRGPGSTPVRNVRLQGSPRLLTEEAPNQSPLLTPSDSISNVEGNRRAQAPSYAEGERRGLLQARAGCERVPEASLVVEPVAGYARHQREAEIINAGNWPGTIAVYKRWRITLVDDVVAASARPDLAFRWIQAVNIKGYIRDLSQFELPISTD